MNLGNKGQIVLHIFDKVYVIQMYELYYNLGMTLIFTLLMLLLIKVVTERYIYKLDEEGKESYKGARYVINHPVIMIPVIIYVLYNTLNTFVRALGLLIGG